MPVLKKPIKPQYIILTIVYFVIFYFQLPGITPLVYIGFLVPIALVYLFFPNYSVLLFTPLLLPTINFDIGLGISPFRIVLLAALIGQVFNNQWSRNKILEINPSIYLGWLIILVSLFVSGWMNQSGFYPEIFIWIVRVLWMLVYISAWINSKDYDYGYWGWTIIGILSVLAGLYALIITNSIFALSTFRLLDLRVYNIFDVSLLILMISGSVCVSFWSLWAVSKSNFFRFLFSLLLIVPLIMSLRRQAYWGMIFSFVIFVLITKGKNKYRLILVAILIFMILISTGVFETITQQIPTLMDEFTGEGTGRYTIYSYGLRAFIEKPVFGWGVGSYKDVMHSYRLVNKLTGEGISSHNSILGLGVESGIFGLIGFVILFVGLFTPIVRVIRDTHLLKNNVVIFTIPLLGYVIAGILVSNVLEVFYYLLALSMITGLSIRWKYETFDDRLDDSS